MADYQAQIRLGIQGLSQLRELENRLENAQSLLRALDRQSANIEQVVGGASRRVQRAGEELVEARRSVANTQQRRDRQGRFLPGPNATARRLALSQERLAARQLREEARDLQELSAARRRYAARLDRAGGIVRNLGPAVGERQENLQRIQGRISRESRINYLQNLFESRSARLQREGGGINLSADQQRQAQNIRAAWALANQEGRENLQLMQRLATEMAGLDQRQREVNMLGGGRSKAFEAARRAQEQLDALAARPGVDDRRIGRLRRLPADVIEAANRGDVTGAQDAQRRMNASILRYTRELDAAARELGAQGLRAGRGLNRRTSWGQFLNEGQEGLQVARTGQAARGLNLNNTWTKALDQLGDNARQLQQTASAKGVNLNNTWTKALGQLDDNARQLQQTAGAKSVNLNNTWTKALAELDDNAKQLQQTAGAKSVNLGSNWTKALTELDDNAKQLQQTAGARSVNLNNTWAKALEQLDDNAKQLQQTAGARSVNLGSSWTKALAELDDGAKQLQQSAGAKRVNLNNTWTKALDLMSDTGQQLQQTAGAKRLNVNNSWAKALDFMDETAQVLQQTAQAKAAKQSATQGKVLGGLADAATKVGDKATAAELAGDQKVFDAKLKQYNELAKRELQLIKQNDKAALASFDRRLSNRGAAKQKAFDNRFFQGNAREAISSGLIGGGFPLLFGQGAGGAVGGGIGGVAGGFLGGGFGFGVSVVGTALGAAVDTLVANLKNLASSLKSPTEGLAALEQSGFRVSDSLKFQVEQLNAVGRAYDAQTLVLQEVERRLGAGSVRELNALSSEQKRLEEQWAVMAGELQSSLLPALLGATSLLADFAAGMNALRSVGIPEWLVNILTVTNPSFALSRAQFEGAQNRGRAVAQGAAGNRQPLPPQEAFAAETARIQKARTEADQIQNAYREAFKLQRQANDLQFEAGRFNRDVADYRYRKEQEIIAMQEQALQKQIDNDRLRAQNQIETQDLDLRETFASASGFEQQLLSNVREAMRTRKEGEADIEQNRRRLELTLSRMQREGNDYSRATAREIEDIERRKLSYIRSVEDYKMQVADYQLRVAREIADLQRQSAVEGMGAGMASYQPVSPTERVPYMAEIDRAAKAGNVDPRLLAGLVRQESNFNPNAVSSAGAIGLGQLMPGTARELGVNPRDIQQNLNGAARYLRQMIDTFGGVEAGLRAYNQGPGNQRRFPAGVSSEAVNYPGLVLGHAQRYGYRPGGSAMAAASGSAIGRTGNTGISSGPHLDVRWADGRPITAADADRFIRVAGRTPSSFGVTSPYGPRQAPVPGASTFHKGIDFGTPAGLPITLTGGATLTGSRTPAQSGGGGVVGIINTPMGPMQLLHLESVLTGPSAQSPAAQMANIPQPRFQETPLGATPAAAPINAAANAARMAMMKSEEDFNKLLEDQIKLKERGVDVSQFEAILQSNQLPQLKEQGDALQQQLAARERILMLTDDQTGLIDLQAERTARLNAIETARRNALAKVGEGITDPADLAQAKERVNKLSDAARTVAEQEGKQLEENLQIQQRLQNIDRARNEIQNLSQGLAIEKAQAAALERGEVEATNVELLKATDLYKLATDQQKAKLEALTAETEELRKQNELRRRINELRRDTGIVGAGLRNGLIGPAAQSFEDVLRAGGTRDQALAEAQAAQALQDQQLIWDNLAKDITNVSDAIAGGLTQGLADIVTGARSIKEVGKEVLDSMARTFLDSAQQQLSVLLQRNIAGALGGEGGLLNSVFGTGTGLAGASGPAALGAAASAAAPPVASLAPAALAASSALQTLAASAAFSGAFSSVGGAVTSGIGGAFSAAAPNLLGSFFGGASPLPFSFGGFFADGGSTKPGEAYVVGEEGPELFIPGISGKVIPNKRTAQQKAAALQDADADEGGTLDVRYEAKTIAGERYVTEEQFRKGMTRAAKQGQAMAYSGMRNNRAVRQQVGM